MCNVCITVLRYICPWATIYIYVYMYIPCMCNAYVSVLRYICPWTYLCICLLPTTGWRRLIGCLTLQVIFCKRATNYRSLLRKMIYEDKAPYASTPPCTLRLISIVQERQKQTVCRNARRVIGCFIFIGHLLQKRPTIRGFFAKNDLQLKASY